MFIHLNLDGPIGFIAYQHTWNSRTPEGQYRKGAMGGVKLPYFYHPIEVSTLIWKWGAGTPLTMKAALGHDLIEDTLVLTEQIIANLGTEALAVIQELTFDDKLCTKEEYLATFKTKSIIALIIKLADRICNTRDFLLTDAKYAKKYWHKADVLFQIYGDRSDEIMNLFDENVIFAIDNSIDDIIQTLRNRS